jgi:integrase
MEPVVGRERIVAFSKGLIKAELEVGTVTTYMGSLRRLFGYVLAFPYIPKIVGAGSNNGAPPPSIVAKYGPIEQPVLEYDYPHHVIDPEEEGLTLTGEKLVEFYNFVRFEYIGKKPKKLAVSRDYTAIVIAGEGGLRVDELRHLDAFGARQDLFFEGGRIQTRFGKAAKGSGKRVRKTIFTPFAQATVHAYLRDIRPHFPNANSDPALFLSNKGSRISYGAMWSNLQGIAAAAREAGFVFPSRFGHHSLRKSFATNFLQQNPDQFWVLMDMMGHMDPSTLYRYLKYSRSHYDRIQDQILAELCPATPAKEP